MLTIAFLTRNEGRALAASLQALEAALTPEDRLVAIDLDSSDETPERLQGFCAARGTEVIRLDTTQLSRHEAQRLAASQSDEGWVLSLRAGDRLCPAPLAALRAELAGSRADLAVLDSGHWLTSPDHPLPRADAARVAALPAAPDAHILTGLCPDPRRLVLSRRRALDRPALPPAHPWRAWAAELAAANHVLFQPGPVLLFPSQDPAPPPDWAFLTEQVLSAPKPGRAAKLQSLLGWVDDALERSPPDAAPELMDGAAGFLRSLPRALRAAARAGDGPAARVFAAWHRDGPAGAMAYLALLAAARQRQASLALGAEYARLRADLDLALPGPDYLADLYARIRGL